jgi:hypothetical protein
MSGSAFLESNRMFGKTVGMAVVGVLWGLAPFVAQAADTARADGPRNDVLFVNGVQVACGPGVAAAAGPGPGPAGEPFRLAVEPRPEAMKDAPYSGVGTTEVVTTLADGNRIVRTNTMRYYRDSKGRTRTEYSLGAVGPFTPDQAQSVVTITDPVESKRYVLHSVMKRADIFPMPDANAKISAVTGTMTSKGGVVMYTQKVIGSGPTPKVALAERGTVAVAPPVMVMSRAAALPPVNAGFIMQYAAPVSGQDACKPNAKPLPSPTALGERIIEGLEVTGTRMEFTIPAGAVGNEQPITVSSEQWFSPDLGVVVSSTHKDPMMGDTTYKLEQVSRAEPDPSLFTVPADYTQNDVTASGGVFFESRLPPPGKPPEKK